MAAEYSQIVTAANVTWQDGTLFNGFILIIGSLPQTDDVTWARAALKDTVPPLEVPVRYKIPVREGVVSPTFVWRTDSLVPAGVKYSAFWYDTSPRLIANGATLFAVTTASHTLAVPTLTTPTAEVTPPTPEDIP